MACTKHLCVRMASFTNSPDNVASIAQEQEHSRATSSSNIDDRTLHEVQVSDITPSMSFAHSVAGLAVCRCHPCWECFHHARL